MKAGLVYLVGAGPGDPQLLTLKAKSLIERADCLVYDALVAPSIVGFARPDCERIFVGKRADNHALPQEEINQLLVSCASKHRVTVRLKGGDPYVFGRGGEEALHLRAANVRFQMVPGISSALAVPAYAGIPVTQRGMCTQLSIFTGHEMDGKSADSNANLNLNNIAQAQGTKIMLMGMKKLDSIIEALIAEGQDPATPAALIQWGCTTRQRKLLTTVGELCEQAKAQGFAAPAILVIGEVASLSDKLDWWGNMPMHGQRVIVTRTREQASALSRSLGDLGAEVLELPMIRISPPSDRHGFAESVVDAPRYDWLVFSSPNGVKKFFQAFFAVYEDIREIGGARIAAVGPGTAAELKKFGLMVDVMPQKAVAEELVAEFDRKSEEFGGIEHSSMLWVHGEQARNYIYRELMKRKAIVDECIAYQTVAETEDPTGVRPLIESEGADWITFTSASTVHHWMKMGIKLHPQCRIASIGPVTTAALAEYKLTPHVEATKHNIASLVETIAQACK